ncbi:uncharacterized protein P884DRAFT_258003 [Thermothelomyces heterothallicus CBS 202.75]|uniref:uncharacterized protein n=1 Tax=Thermothelomyces heterothallicus CBS 202.75 TaxID=1149848 RepID=UPI003743C16C
MRNHHGPVRTRTDVALLLIRAIQAQKPKPATSEPHYVICHLQASRTCTRCPMHAFRILVKS